MNLLDSDKYKCDVCGSTAEMECSECGKSICFDCCDIYHEDIFNDIDYEVCLKCFEKLTDTSEGIYEE